MKKRSLVAALAMLVVSAIVLTSSTYAWFAASSQANVNKLSANVTNDDGSLTVSADNLSFSGSIGAEDYVGKVPENLVPVSISVDNGTVSGYKVSYDGGSFFDGGAATAVGATTDDYMKYTYYVKYVNGNEAAKKVVANTTFTDGGFCYGIVDVNVGGVSTMYYFNDAGVCTPVTSITGTVNDTYGGKNNAIVDAGDTLVDSATVEFGEVDIANKVQTGANIDIMEVAINTTTVATVTVYVWAEGQHADCSGTNSASNVGFSFSLSAANA